MNAPQRLLRALADPDAQPLVSSAVLLELHDDGYLLVDLGTAGACLCAWLEGEVSPPLAPGDTLLIVRPSGDAFPVALGRIGRYAPPQPQKTVILEATESLTLKCGEASVELRADGRAMVKGEDVLLRAKGTQRIRAGNVAIN